MKIAFTICSANYLPFAKALADSVVQHNAEYVFFIALADTYTQYDAETFLPHRIIPVSEMKIEPLKEMNEKYSIFELSCALKPFVAKCLLTSIPECDSLFYFDADILVYHRLADAEAALESHSIVLTPHIATPSPYPNSINTELEVLRTGLYNAGFFGLRSDKQCFAFLDWWQERVKNHCYNRALEGLFVDQVWLNFVPLYFERTCILFHPGYNLAYWNFNERTIARNDDGYVVNGKYPLIFFHFSGYDIQNPDLVSKHRPAFTLATVAQYESLFREYQKLVMGNNATRYFLLPVTMGKALPTSSKRRSRLLSNAFTRWSKKGKGKFQ